MLLCLIPRYCFETKQNRDSKNEVPYLREYTRFKSNIIGVQSVQRQPQLDSTYSAKMRLHYIQVAQHRAERKLLASSVL